MPQIRKKKVTDIPGTPESVTVELIDGQPVAVNIMMVGGAVFTIQKTGSYSEHLSIVGDEPPKTKPYWFVNCRYKDGGTSSRSFDNKDDADMELNEKRKERDFTAGEVTMKDVKVDEDDKPINDDIPF